ncbi:MAG: RNA polymerase sigma factor [Candidatus Poribacteria bacterium]|nr:RNA polymerase sigma factor [Candidatus Poribacteria bacterium]
MRSDDVGLIHRILAGDENAFATLIEKYQRQVHALAFRKVGDFQTAEDITQETFLQVHQKLATLNDPTKFSGWIYAIANHLCIAWYRKNRLQTEALQEIYISEIETEAYSRYIAREHAKTTAEVQHDLVKSLLTKLKERDREVITLHYFEEMTSSEIGELLGVSENTIKSRLHRARQQLKKYEPMIQEVLNITTTSEGEHRSQPLSEGETIMTNEVRNGSKVEAKLEEMQRQITDLQAQIKDIAANSDASTNSDKKQALNALLRLPDHAKDPITWCYAGAYHAASGQRSSRGSVWTTSTDKFLSNAPDAEIVNLAKYFTNPTVVAVLRHLVEGKKSVADLANGCGISESEMEETVEMLADGALVKRTEDDLIEPKNDAVFYFLNFVGMVTVYLNPEDYHSQD